MPIEVICGRKGSRDLSGRQDLDSYLEIPLRGPSADWGDKITKILSEMAGDRVVYALI